MPPEIHDDESTDGSQSTSEGRFARLKDGLRGGIAWAKSSRLRATIVVAGGLAVLGSAVVVILALAMTSGEPVEHVELEMALEALEGGDYVEARRLAELLRVQGLAPDEALGGPEYVLGIATADEADASWTTDKMKFHLLSARYLQDARDLGFPEGREAKGLFTLGKSLYLSEQMAASRSAFEAALEINPEQRTEIEGLLADTYLKDANPKYPEALEHNSLHLADAELPSDARHQGLVQRAVILLQMDRIPECIAALDTVPQSAKNFADAVVVRGQLLMHEARQLTGTAEATQKYQTAIKTFQFAQERDTLATQATRKSMYLIAVCFLEMEDYRAALNQFSRTERTFPETSEAMSANFEYAELSRYLQQPGQVSGEGESEAIAAYGRALTSLTDSRTYRNPWLSLDELRTRTLQAIQYYTEVEDFEAALAISRLTYPAFSKERTMQVIAETYRAWGGNLLDRAAQLSHSEAKPLFSEGRARLRDAGLVYQRLARFRGVGREYPDDLWNCAESYIQGRAYKTAIPILNEYLRNTSRRRHPRALLYLGEALLAIGHTEMALEEFTQCIDFYPRDAAAFRARLIASQAYAETEQLEKAREMLEENLYGDFMDPNSNEWQQSLFALGRMLHMSGEYEEAVIRLEEAVQRYGDSAEAVEGQYLIADALRRSAKQVSEQLQADQAQGVRAARSRRVSLQMNESLANYAKTQATLLKRQEASELTDLEKAMLRNSFFSIGSIHFDLGGYDQAIAAYTTATLRYQNAPEVLEAYTQIARSYRRLDRTADARQTLEKAKVVMERMKGVDTFTETTIYAAEEWPDLLNWLSTL